MATGSYKHDSNWAKVKPDRTDDYKNLLSEYDDALRNSERTRRNDAGECFVKFESPTDTFYMDDEEHGECWQTFLSELTPMLAEPLTIKNISHPARGDTEVAVFELDPEDGFNTYKV